MVVRSWPSPEIEGHPTTTATLGDLERFFSQPSKFCDFSRIPWGMTSSPSRAKESRTGALGALSARVITARWRRALWTSSGGWA